MKKKENSMSYLLRPHKNKALILCKIFTEDGFYDDYGSDYGSLDTATREIFFECLLNKLKEDKEVIPKAEEWRLYEGEYKEDVGQKMTDSLKELYNLIDDSLNLKITEIYEFYKFPEFKID